MKPFLYTSNFQKLKKIKKKIVVKPYHETCFKSDVSFFLLKLTNNGLGVCNSVGGMLVWHSGILGKLSLTVHATIPTHGMTKQTTSSRSRGHFLSHTEFQAHLGYLRLCLKVKRLKTRTCYFQSKILTGLQPACSSVKLMYTGRKTRGEHNSLL